MIDSVKLPHLMKYMGSKRELLDFIISSINDLDIESNWFCDLFSGTSIDGCSLKDEYNIDLGSLLTVLAYPSSEVEIAIPASKLKQKDIVNAVVNTGTGTFDLIPCMTFISLIFAVINAFIAIMDYIPKSVGYIACTIWIAAAFILFGITIIGKYFGKMYFDVLKRPGYIVDEEIR